MNVILVSVLAVMLLFLVALLLFYFFKVAPDAQTAQLLSTMLPARVVEGITVARFQQLRTVASQHAADIRRGSIRHVTRKDSVTLATTLPVLYRGRGNLVLEETVSGKI